MYKIKSPYSVEDWRCEVIKYIDKIAKICYKIAVLYGVNPMLSSVILFVLRRCPLHRWSERRKKRLLILSYLLALVVCLLSVFLVVLYFDLFEMSISPNGFAPDVIICVQWLTLFMVVRIIQRDIKDLEKGALRLFQE